MRRSFIGQAVLACVLAWVQGSAGHPQNQVQSGRYTARLRQGQSLPRTQPGGSAALLRQKNTAGPGGAPAARSDFLRGVNIGAWLVLEQWMTPWVFEGTPAKDQWTFDGLPGAQEKLKMHWESYFTRGDIQFLSQVGINAIRIPIGFWAYDNRGTPYQMGADAYLERAIGWAQQAGIKVWVDVHGMPGSQNGFDNSGKAGAVEWQQPDNLRRSIEVLKVVATKYGAQRYAGTVVGLQMINEPISWGANNFEITRTWAAEAYQAVAAVAANRDMKIIMHDAFRGAGAWTDLPAMLQSNGRFGVDSHLYQVFVPEDKLLTQEQHIRKACGWGKELRQANAVMPVFVGEWSAATDTCVNSDGITTSPGNSCPGNGCQCQGDNPDQWRPPLVAQVRRYVEAQLDTFEQNTSGFFIWSYKAPGAWNFVEGIQHGFIPNPITSRKFPGQCGQ